MHLILKCLLWFEMEVMYINTLFINKPEKGWWIQNITNLTHCWVMGLRFSKYLNLLNLIKQYLFELGCKSAFNHVSCICWKYIIYCHLETIFEYNLHLCILVLNYGIKYLCCKNLILNSWRANYEKLLNHIALLWKIDKFKVNLSRQTIIDIAEKSIYSSLLNIIFVVSQ